MLCPMSPTFVTVLVCEPQNEAQETWRNVSTHEAFDFGRLVRRAYVSILLAMGFLLSFLRTVGRKRLQIVQRQISDLTDYSPTVELVMNTRPVSF